MTPFENLTFISIGVLALLFIIRPKWLLATSSSKINIKDYLGQDKKRVIIRNRKLHENKCREIIERYFNKSNSKSIKFPSVRPDFLKGFKNKNLELDMYNHELKLAFEYDGVQHAKYNKHFHKGDYNNFIKQQENDKLKDQICRNLGIKLIRIPHTVKYNDLEGFILEKITQADIRPHVSRQL